MVSSTHAQSVGWDEQQESWKTKHSKHFTIIYLEQHQSIAEHVLRVAETVQKQLYPFYKVIPKKRTRIILTDDSDFNITPTDTLEYGEIRLSMSPPTDVATIETQDNWYHLYLMNEYSQILHFELADGTFRGLVLAAEFTPSVLYKGVALYLQNNNDLSSNLLNVSSSQMKMRMEVERGRLRELNKIVIQTRDWPYDAMYIYGAYFIDYLCQTYGEEKVLAFLKDYSQSIFAYLFLNQETTPYFGKDLYTLWSEYQLYLKQRFSKQIKAINQPVSGEKLLDLNFLLAVSAGESGLLINMTNGEDRHSIQQLQDNQWVNLSYVNQVRSFDNHATEGLVMTRTIAHADKHTLNDIFIFNHNQWQQVTDRGRFKYVRWLKDGQHFIASRIVNGISELWLYQITEQADSQKLWQGKILWQGKQDELLGDFDISLDDSYLVASFKAPLDSWKLYRFDLQNKHWQRLTQQQGTETNPSFTSLGTLVYSANYQQIYNIYQYSLETGEISQLTNVIGGAFRPIWQADLGLVFQTYETDGYALRVLKTAKALKQLDTQQTTQTSLKQQANYPKVKTSQAKDYSSLSTLQSHSLYPVLYANEIRALAGINTYGADALGRHNYDIYLLWDLVYEQASYVFKYQYDNRWTLSYTQDYNFDNLTPDLDDANYEISQTQVYLLQRDNIFNAWEDKFGFHSGLTYTKDKVVSTPDVEAMVPEGTITDSANELTLGLGITFDNREYYLNVPGTGWGHYFDLTFEENIIKADFSGQKIQSQWLFTFDLPKRFTLLTRLAGGYADADAKPFAVGGNHLTEEMRLFDRSQQSIRGYDDLTQLGHIYTTQRLELNAFLGRFEQNFGLFPLGMGDIAGKLYMDSGTAWDKGESAELLVGVGAQIEFEFKLAYNYQLPITFGYAQGLNKNLGKNYLYINFGNSY